MSKRKVEKIEAHIEETEGKPPDQAWFIPSDEERSIYRFIIAGAKRARQLQGGARPLISTTSRKPTKIAMEEVRRGEIAVEIQPDPEKEAAAAKAKEE
jgi:DNA-directed RNA polymerase subunit omega